MGNKFDMISAAESGSINNLNLLNETFHVFSKSPASNVTTLGGARLKSGHTTTASDVWADEIPAFFSAANQAKFDLFSSLAVKDDLCIFGGKVYQHNGTQFVSLGTEAEVLVDGATFQKNNKDVIKYHKNRTAINLTADNNNGDGSNNLSAKIYDAATGSTNFVSQFISSTDKMVAGVPSLAYDATVVAGGVKLAEGLTNDNDYICNAYAGVIQFNKARSSGVTVSAWEYIGDKLTTSISDLRQSIKDISDVTLKGVVASVTADANTAQKAGITVDNTVSTTPVIKVTTGSVATGETKLVTGGTVAAVTDALSGRVDSLTGTTTTGISEAKAAAKAAQDTADAKVASVTGPTTGLVTVSGDTAVTITVSDQIATKSDAATAASTAITTSLNGTTAGTIGAAVAAAKSGAEQTAATALSTARGEITTEISTAVSGLETKLTTGEGSLGAKVAALETATGTTLPAAIQQALTDAKAYSDSLHTTSLDYVVLGDSESLPTASANTLGKIYLVASQNAPTADGAAISGSYVEYMTRKVSETEYTWEKIGTTAADLSAYAKTSEVTAAVAAVQGEVDALETTHATDKAALEASIATKVGEVQWFGENDLLSTKAEIKDGKLVVSEQEVTNPNRNTSNGTRPWNANAIKVVNNEAFNANGEKIGTIETSKIKNGTAMFYQSNLSEYESDLSSLTIGTWMFSTSKVEEFIGDISSLTQGDDMFAYIKELHTFIGDLSSLTEGRNMFVGCPTLTTFISDLSSLTNGESMFSSTNLSLESVECIADTINEYEDGIEISWKTLPAEDKRQEFVDELSRIVDKGWTLHTNQELLSLFDSEKYQTGSTKVQPLDLESEPQTVYYVVKK